jgi:predicted amidophosphoribosyltransferase
MRFSGDRDGRIVRWVALTVLDALRDAWAVLVPVECAGCQSHDHALCAPCARALLAVPTIHRTPHGVRVYAALQYEAEVRNILLAFKNRHRTDQARPLAGALMSPLREALAEFSSANEIEHPPLIVAVPSSRRAFRRRGYHPMSLVLRAVGIRHARVLRAAKEIGSQKLLGAQQRAVNVQGAFIATRWLGTVRVMIVDDVLTTGATIDEAARAISAAGGTVIAAVTIGFTPRILTARDIVSGEGYGKEKGAQ